MQHIYEVLSPLGIPQEINQVKMADRLPDLAHKVIYCVAQTIMGSEAFIERVAKALSTYAPEAKVVYKRKSAAYMTDEPDFWKDIASKADAIIYGCGV